MHKLYSYFRSSASFRVRIVLNLKQRPFETAAVHLVNLGGEQYLPAYQAVNPASTVPSLEVDGQFLTQSAAICEYLNEVVPEPALLPSDLIERAWVRSIYNLVACDVHPFNNLRVLKYLKDTLGLDEEQKNRWYQYWIANGFTALEKMLQPKAGRYCWGDTVTLADAFLVPQIWNAHRFKCPMDNYPTLQRIYDVAMQQPEFIQAAPANQPDAPNTN